MSIIEYTFMLASIHDDLQNLADFLQTPTPKPWLDAALENIPLLLLDHAHCERKAAATAINFMSKYPELSDLVKIMSPLAREELLHFEKVLELMTRRQIEFGPLQSCNYAQKLHSFVTPGGNRDRLRDQLIVGAIIEARSCERFFKLIPLLTDEELKRFYLSLVKSEARHFKDYITLARTYGRAVDNRLEFFLQIENELITKKDRFFRFHSGVL